MPFTACIQPLDRYLRITVAGSLNAPEETMEYLALVARMADEYSLTRILLDELRLGLTAELLDVYSFADSHLAQGMIERGFRLACLPNLAHRDFLLTVETILNNRSLSFRVFNLEAEAIAWLNR